MATPSTTRRLTLAEVAEHLRCPLGRVRSLIKAGQLRAIDVSVKPGSKRPRLIVDEADLADFERRRATAPPARQVIPRVNGRGAVPNYFG